MYRICVALKLVKNLLVVAIVKTFAHLKSMSYKWVDIKAD